MDDELDKAAADADEFAAAVEKVIDLWEDPWLREFVSS